jgi:hypothetical protein
LARGGLKILCPVIVVSAGLVLRFFRKLVAFKCESPVPGMDLIPEKCASENGSFVAKFREGGWRG